MIINGQQRLSKYSKVLCDRMPNLELPSPYLLVAEQPSVRSSDWLDLLQDSRSVSQPGLATTKIRGIKGEPELNQNDAKRSSPPAELSPPQPKVSTAERSDVLGLCAVCPYTS
jgi:hypothetical protein